MKNGKGKKTLVKVRGRTQVKQMKLLQCIPEIRPMISKTAICDTPLKMYVLVAALKY